MTVTTCCTIETCGSAEYFDLTASNDRLRLVNRSGRKNRSQRSSGWSRLRRRGRSQWRSAAFQGGERSRTGAAPPPRPAWRCATPAYGPGPLARSACTEHTTGVVTAVHPVESDRQRRAAPPPVNRHQKCPSLPAAPRRGERPERGSRPGTRSSITFARSHCAS